MTSLVVSNFTPALHNLIGDYAIPPNAIYKEEVLFDPDDTSGDLDVSDVTSWEVYLKTNRDDEDADAVATGEAVTWSDTGGEVDIYFGGPNGTSITPDMIGAYWWVLRGSNGVTTQTFLWGKAEVKFL